MASATLEKIFMNSDSENEFIGWNTDELYAEQREEYPSIDDIELTDDQIREIEEEVVILSLMLTVTLTMIVVSEFL